MNEQSVEIVRQLPTSQMLKDPHRLSRLFKIVIQTLDNIGYKEAARVLEKESGTPYFDATAEALQQSLSRSSLIQQEQAVLVDKLIQSKDPKTQDQMRLTVLELMLGQIASQQQPAPQQSLLQETLPAALLQKQRDRLMLEKVNSYSKEHAFASREASERFDSIVSDLVFSPERFEHVDSRRLIGRLFDLSNSTGIDKWSMQRSIQFYADHRFGKNGPSASQELYELCKFSFVETGGPTPAELPRNLQTVHTHQTKYEITQIAINEAMSLIATIGVSMGPQQSQICVWTLKPRGVSETKDPASETVSEILKHLVTCVAWSHGGDDEEALLATASRSSITLFNRELQKKAVLTEVDALCCRFNPLNHLLYSGGLNNHQIRVWDKSGEQLDTYRTGPVREIYFGKNGTCMYLVSSSSYLLTKMDTSEAEKTAELSIVNPILDVSPASQTELIVSSSHQLYLVKEANLQILRSFELEGKQGDLQYYSYARCWGSWYIVSGEHSFKAISSHGKCQTVKWKHQSTYPAFEYYENETSGPCLVSSKGKKLCFWSVQPSTLVQEQQTEARCLQQESEPENSIQSEMEEAEFEEEDDDLQPF